MRSPRRRHAQWQTTEGADRNTSMYHALNGVELTFEDANDPSNRSHALKFLLCEHAKAVVNMTVGNRAPLPAVKPVRDFELAVLPFYWQTLRHHHPNKPSAMGYISRKDKVGTIVGRIEMPGIGVRSARPQLQQRRVEPISASFYRDVTLHLPFRASEWPGNEEQLRELIKEAIDSFIARINSG